jgi:hypothetical protein
MAGGCPASSTRTCPAQPADFQDAPNRKMSPANPQSQSLHLLNQSPVRSVPGQLRSRPHRVWRCQMIKAPRTSASTQPLIHGTMIVDRRPRLVVTCSQHANNGIELFTLRLRYGEAERPFEKRAWVHSSAATAHDLLSRMPSVVQDLQLIVYYAAPHQQ